ncbi:MAG: septum formation protein Maf [Bdellovibrionales bacterium]|nr:septum formation protein Maf [Bdellovibrionales bacterium]
MSLPILRTADGVRLVLASESPRRRELLSSLGLDFDVVPSSIEEVTNLETPEEMVRELSYLKAIAVARSLPNEFVLAADTLVALGSNVLGKPADIDDAVRMLETLSGQTHKVWGGICCVRVVQNEEERKEKQKEEVLFHCTVMTEVEFYHLDRELIHAYLSTGEFRDKAGGYGIQGQGQIFVRGINGSYSNVVGLDTAQVARELVAIGVARVKQG